MDTCKYVHYEIDSPPEAEGSPLGPQAGAAELALHSGDTDSNVGKLFPSQVRKDPFDPDGATPAGGRGVPPLSVCGL